MIHEIDIAGMIPAALVGYPAAVMAVIPDIAEAARNEISRLAGERLGVSSDQYIQGLMPVQYHYPSGKLPPGVSVVATIALAGWLPNAIENGWSGGDMKQALLGGRNAKINEDGEPYIIVPFRHGAPGGSSRNFQKMGSAHERIGNMTHAASKKMGRSVHRAAKNMRASQSGSTRGAERMQAGMSPLLRPHHTTSIHTGLVRQTKSAGGRTEQYKSFRTVTRGSQGWVHPGIEARHLFADAGEYIGKAAEHLLEQATRGMHDGGS